MSAVWKRVFLHGHFTVLQYDIVIDDGSVALSAHLGYRWMQAKCLLDHPCKVWKVLVDVLVSRLAFLQHSIKLFAQSDDVYDIMTEWWQWALLLILSLDVWVLVELVEHPCESTGSGVAARDEKIHDDVAQFVVRLSMTN